MSFSRRETLALGAGALIASVLPFRLSAATEVNAPRLVIRSEGQGLEGDCHLGNPPFVVPRGRPLPDTFPLPLHLVWPEEKAFATDTVRVELKLITFAAAVVGIENQYELIVIEYFGTLPEDVRADQVRAAIPQACPDIERVGIIEDVELTLLGWL